MQCTLLFLQCLRQIPMIQCDHWLNVVSQQSVDELVIVINARLVDVALTVW